MARKNRRDIVKASEVGLYLVSSRTVRRAFLLGNDPATGRDRSYRRRVIEKRMEDLASVFAVEVCDYSIADNHFFAILRIRPDLVPAWNDREVARRWLRVNRSRLELEPEPSAEMVDRLVMDDQRLGRARKALSCLSEFMGCLKQAVACEANLYDEVTDNFWGGRFQAVPLENEATLVASSAYVNMQLIRAERADGLADSEYTSAYVRLRDEQLQGLRDGRREVRNGEESDGRNEGRTEGPSSGWMQPVEVCVEKSGYDGAAAGRRASNDGYVRMTFAEQRELIDSLLKYERDVQVSRDAFLKPELPAVLERVGVNAEQWVRAVLGIRRRFNHELLIMQKRIAEANEASLRALGLIDSQEQLQLEARSRPLPGP